MHGALLPVVLNAEFSKQSLASTVKPWVQDLGFRGLGFRVEGSRI